ncbi:lysozyme [Rhizobium sp. SAFR-030]|uniref:lysozyme n=1 Tax=Rhizobium sp. SAFR-030 TaxID=3387277 RepID=UPI003F8027D6
MNLVANWRRVVALSLSFWMQAFGLLALIGPEVWYYFTGHDYNPYIAFKVGVGFGVAGLFGRLWQQTDSVWAEWVRIACVIILIIGMGFLFTSHADAAENKAPPPTEAQVLDMAVPFIIQREGIRLNAYLDGVGVATICGGLTTASGIKVYIGMPAMKMDDCLRYMRVLVARYRLQLHGYFTSDTISNRLPATRDTAYTSLAWNAGVPTIGKSTAVRRLNAGDIAGGCEAITWFDKGGGRVMRGLFERRKAEKALCLAGL